MRHHALPLLFCSLALFLISCGGGGGSGDSGTATPRFNVGGTLQGINAGQVGQPGFVTLHLEASSGSVVRSSTFNEDGSFNFNVSLLKGADYRVDVANTPNHLYCSIAPGSDTGTVPAADVDDIQVSCVNREHTVKGDINSSQSSLVDTDVNDPDGLNIDNSGFDTAQAIYTPSTVQGFLTTEPTGNSDDAFADIADTDDFFAVSLVAGQVIRLQVAAPDEGDLDLILWHDDTTLAGQSTLEGSNEEIAVIADGDYYVNVNAFSGASSYILSIDDGSGSGILSHSQSVDFVPGEAIVKMRPGYIPLSRQNADVMSAMSLSHRNDSRPTLARFDTVATADLTPAGTVRALNTGGVNPRLETLRHIKRLRQTPGVEYAEPNYWRRPLVMTPNDPLYGQQWGLPAMNLPGAWDITTGTPDSGEVIVAIVDTGLFLTHPDLENQLVPGYDFIADPGAAGDGDGIDPDPSDVSGVSSSPWHGTHVAGIVAADTNNGKGIAGVSWGAKLMPLRVSGGPGSTSYDIMQALRYAAGMENDSGIVPAQAADIINVSLGGPGWLESAKELYESLFEAGIIVVASAGNDDTTSPGFPASYATVLSVGATGFDGDKAYYSNYGLTIDLVAPGGDGINHILSTDVDDIPNPPEAAYAGRSGTSMAAPHVSGMMALMKAVYPELTAEIVRDLLHDTQLTQDIGDSGFDSLYGFGLADALKAVEIAQQLASGAPLLPPAPTFLVPSPDEVSMMGDTSAPAFIFNKGSGNPMPTSLSTSASWLEARMVEENNPALVRLEVSVDRTNLPEGDHSGEVLVSFDNGDTVTVPVLMTIDTLISSGQLGQVYVVLASADGEMSDDPYSDPVDIQVLDDSSRFYTLDHVRPGAYYIVTGSDIDNDGLICNPGESCGIYPSLDNPEIVVIDENSGSLLLDVITPQILREPLSVPGLSAEGVPRE